MNAATRLLLVLIFAIGLSLAGCKDSGGNGHEGHDHDEGAHATNDTDDADHEHDHGEGDDDAAHGADGGDGGDDSGGDSGDDSGGDGGGDHAHTEIKLGKISMGDMTVECWQGHGRLQAGAESHLVVKLPHNDQGASEVRAWIGDEDRLNSMVGMGEYASSHDDYDIHAEAPDPLPADAMWWIEVTMPDGTTAVGSIKPRR